MKTAKKNDEDFADKILEITIPVTLRQIADTMCSAIECNDMTRSWCVGIELESAEYGCPAGENWYFWPGTFNGGFRILLRELSDERTGKIKKRYIGPDDLRKGLSIMAQKEPKHFADMMVDNGDAITADIFLQCVALGEVIYG